MLKFFETNDYLEKTRRQIAYIPLDENIELCDQAISFIRMLYLGAFVDV